VAVTTDLIEKVFFKAGWCWVKFLYVDLGYYKFK